jgi:hypothetical protein
MVFPTQRVNNAYPSPAQANQVNVTAAPAGTFNTDSIDTAFQGDMVDVTFAVAQSITGASTLGTPTTGYTLNPQVSGYYNYLFNSSGYNYSTSTNDGRTLASLHFDKVDNYGQGDVTAYYASSYVNNTRAGATSWLASPAGCLFIGQCDAGANGVYLNPIEIDCNDNGYDAAAISFVSNLNRTNNTAALGQPWIGFRSQSYGSRAVDAFLSASGSFTIGMDLTTTTLGASSAAIALAQGQRIYFGSTNSGGFPLGTSPTGAYISSNSNILSLTNGSVQLQLSTGQLTTTGSVQTGGLVLPLYDNAYTCGASGYRWSAVWAANAIIQTSDLNAKLDIVDSPLGLSFINDLRPVSYKFKVGSNKIEENLDDPLTPTITPIPGKRQHFGLIAQEVRAALPDGVDFGGWVQSNLEDINSEQGLRYDEFIAPMIKAIQELSVKNNMLEARLAALEGK